ncbi:MAG: hypothetical protein H0W08_06915 [Acidobacteria bacterium]|nr:hypothetical protein [Acidobacteriota bacterium]
MFTSTSRYYSIANATTVWRRRTVVYKRRRLLPQGDEMPLLVEVTVIEGDRLDIITARTLGDPEQFWRVCDANNAMSPFDLTRENGRTLRVPIPQAQV